MATPVIMPRQGQSVETCIITQWHKSKGDKVTEGDLLFSYETDKAAFDEEAKTNGVLLELYFEEGEEVPVLENVAVIGNEGEETREFSPGGTKNQEAEIAPIEESSNKQSEPEQDKKSESQNSNSSEKKRISPLARKLSKEMGIKIDTIKGSGPHGRIIKSDIETASKFSSTQQTKSKEAATSDATPPQPAPEISEENQDFRVEKLSNMRKIIAGKMHESLQNSAQLTHHLSADARKLLLIRKNVKQAIHEAKTTEDITINDLVCFAVIKALKKHPHMNAHFLGDTIKTFHKIHLGIAVDTNRGLMVPALLNADDLNLQGLAARLKTLARECKEGSIHPDLLSSTRASFTISNLGAFGIEMFTPVINLPQTGILGVNTITYKPTDTGDGIISFVPHIGLSLTYDHRAVDGAPASAFLKEIKMQIEQLPTDIV